MKEKGEGQEQLDLNHDLTSLEGLFSPMAVSECAPGSTYSPPNMLPKGKPNLFHGRYFVTSLPCPKCPNVCPRAYNAYFICPDG